MENIKQAVISVYSPPLTNAWKENTTKSSASTGTGFFLKKLGTKFCVTGLHVVADRRLVYVRSQEGIEFDAKVVYSNAMIDLAILEVSDFAPPPIGLDLGSSAELEIGERVIAMGNPGGLKGTFTSGILSEHHRSGLGAYPLEDLLQFDAELNPGNSGGPLLNQKGEVVGLNLLMRSGFSGVGFAQSSELVDKALNDFLSHGASPFTFPYFGIYATEVTRSLLDQGYPVDPKEYGLFVLGLTEDSPAKALGLHYGDIIKKIAGQDVRTHKNLMPLFLPLRVGDPISIEVLTFNSNRSASERRTLELRSVVRPLEPTLSLSNLLLCRFKTLVELSYNPFSIHLTKRFEMKESTRGKRPVETGSILELVPPVYRIASGYQRVVEPVQSEEQARYFIEHYGKIEGSSYFNFAVKYRRDSDGTTNQLYLYGNGNEPCF